MNETLTITTERVDDLPLLLAQLARMGIPALLDDHFPMHGHWRGLSLGWVTTLWLTHVLSQADHRMNRVQPWAEQRLETLRRCSQQPVCPLDVSDDRLAAVLRALSADARWAAFEGALTGRLLRVYDLGAERVRLDSTSASGYWQVTDEGLFQFGHSKDHRPDLPQVKVMLATLDPLGLPLATDVLSGERADDPLYLPAIARVRASVARQGLLYVGDCKLAALETRASIQASHDYYLCPLSARQWSPTLLAPALAAVERGEQPLLPVTRVASTGETETIAEGYEWMEPLTAVVEGQLVRWEERRLLVRSSAQARAAEQALRARVGQARAEVLALTARRRGKPRLSDAASAQQAAEAILTRWQVGGLVQVTVTEEVRVRPVRGYRGQPATVRAEREVHLQVTVDPAALEQAVQRLGWRVYVTNQPAAQLSLPQAVLAYREEYLVERCLGRLKGQPLSLTPMYLTRDDHATGLVRLLAIALRVLTLLEFVVRRQLKQDGGHLAGLYAGQPTRTTSQPTAERLVAAFQHLTLTTVHTAQRTLRHLTPLSTLQGRILTLLGFPLAIYTHLADDSAQPP